MFTKDMKISLLLDFYGETLSERRREIMELYYNDDLSLSEIAELKGISRQGVRDSIKKSEAELDELESKLGLAARFESLKGEVDKIASLLSMASAMSDGDAKGLIDESIKKLNGLDI